MPPGRPRGTTLTMSEWKRAERKWVNIVERAEGLLHANRRTDDFREQYSKFKDAVMVNCTYCYRYEGEEPNECKACPLHQNPPVCFRDNQKTSKYLPYWKVRKLAEEYWSHRRPRDSRIIEAINCARQVLFRIRASEPGNECPFEEGDRVVSLQKSVYVPRKGVKGTIRQVGIDDIQVDWDNSHTWWTCLPSMKVIKQHVALYVEPEKPKPKKVRKPKAPKKVKRHHCPNCDSMAPESSEWPGLANCPTCSFEFAY